MELTTKINAIVTTSGVLREDDFALSVTVAVPVNLAEPERKCSMTSDPGDISAATMAEVQAAMTKARDEALRVTTARAIAQAQIMLGQEILKAKRGN